MDKSIKTEIVINASKEKVWQILTDFSNYPTWNPFIVSIKGDLLRSKRLVNTLASGSKTYVFKPKILSIVQNQYFDWVGKLFISGLFDGHHYFEIDELSPNQIKFTQGEYFSGILSNYILKKIGDETRNNFVRMNAALKAKAETSL
ncbi:MAG: SRPBCC domain-containing protein [Chitinophagaceae bacterium]|nr:MAG: SRPBCC domain-containing protein [Chitinophagaceae bacterium]